MRNIENFLDYDYIFLKDILVGVKNNNILKFEDIEDLNNNSKENIFKLKEDLIFNNNQEDINYFSDIIYDYNFSKYFNIIYNYYFIDLENYESKNIVENLKDSKINIINLLIYYILGYKYYFDENIVLYDNLSLINKIDKIFYINLEEHEKRRDNLNQILNKFNIEFEKYNGFNGYKIDNIKNKYFIDKIISNDNSNLEYAVLLSHLSLIKKLEKESGEYFLIFEDDLCLDFNKYWSESIENIISQAPDDWEIIMLGYFTLNLKFQNNFRKWNNDWSALSYIIKKSSIYKINDYITNDKFYVFDDVNVADNYIFRVFNTYLYHKPLFTIKNNNTSTFHKDHDIYQKIYKNINYLILNDLISIHF